MTFNIVTVTGNALPTTWVVEGTFNKARDEMVARVQKQLAAASEYDRPIVLACIADTRGERDPMCYRIDEWTGVATLV